MPISFLQPTGGADHPDVATYKSLRTAGETWIAKIMRQAESLGFDVLGAAKKLALTFEGKTLVFEDETEQPALVDYYLFDYRPNGKSLVESCVFAPGELTPLESEIHRANLASGTSLYEVAEVHAQQPKFLLRDRLNPASDLWLIDLNLSATFRRFDRKVFMFTRVVTHGEIHCTSGYSFIFEEKVGHALAEEYRRATWSVPAPLRDRRRIGWFLHRNRQHGLPQAGADVVPHSAP
jgi:hypothetical protein